MRKAKQSTAKNVMVLMVDSTDHVTGKTGLTLTITASKDGGAFGAISPTVTERGDGWYNLALTSSHTDTLGDLALHITGLAADPADMVLLVEAQSVDDVLPTASYTAPDNATIALIPDIPAAIGSRIIEGSLTADQIERIQLAALAGKVSGAGSGIERFKGQDGETDRIVSTVDSSGNRVGVVLNGS